LRGKDFDIRAEIDPTTLDGFFCEAATPKKDGCAVWYFKFSEKGAISAHELVLSALSNPTAKIGDLFLIYCARDCITVPRSAKTGVTGLATEDLSEKFSVVSKVGANLASISTLLGSPNSCLACYGNEWVHDPKRQPYLIDS